MAVLDEAMPQPPLLVEAVLDEATATYVSNKFGNWIYLKQNQT